MPKSLFEKVWSAYTARTLANGQTQLIIGTHLVHEVTSPQAFGMLRDLGLIAVPGSQIVALQCEKLGFDKILSEAGFDWRATGCSMCLAMNPDKLIGDQLCASSSKRNFKGRQGSTTGRTLLMSPVMVAAAAGSVADAREVFAFTAN